MKGQGKRFIRGLAREGRWIERGACRTVLGEGDCTLHLHLGTDPQPIKSTLVTIVGAARATQGPHGLESGV